MKGKGAITTGVLAAIAASSCCIPPVIAAIAGASGASSNLSWMEPFRPYLIGIAVLAIGYAWYAHLKSKQEDDCGCSIKKLKWYQTRSFLIGMTIFATIAISFPYYSGMFFPDNSKNVVVVDKTNLETIEVNIEGMTCEACQNHVNHAVQGLDGIVSIETSYDKGNAIITYDKSKTDQKKIKKAIETTGYIVKEIME